MYYGQGKGTMSLNDLQLNDTIFIPNLQCNLLFAKSLVNDLNCQMKFTLIVSYRSIVWRRQLATLRMNIMVEFTSLMLILKGYGVMLIHKHTI